MPNASDHSESAAILAGSFTARRSVYTLLIVLATSMAAGRIMATAFVYDPSSYRDESDPKDTRKLWPKVRPKPMPTFSSNDRSRWATVRALVDDGTFVIGRRDPSEPGGVNQYGDRGVVFENGWETVDKVLDPDTRQFYSSKPPLLTVLAAGEYWLLNRTFGWSITEEPSLVIRTILLTFNLLPLAIYLFLLSRLVEDSGVTDWGRLFVLAAGCFGTLVTPFLTTLNNHTLGTFSALFAIYPVLRACKRCREAEDDGNSVATPLELVCAGFFAALCVTMELPAAAFAAVLFALLCSWTPRRTLAFFLPAALAPAAAFLLTNYAALGEWTPAYEKFGGPWYEYEGSHWKVPPGTVKTGIDFAHEDKAVYAFHLLFGHHGLLSLTPVFLLAVATMLFVLPPSRGIRSSPPEGGATCLPRIFFPATLLVSVVVVAFYIFRTNNYGGWSVGPRWLIWLTPLFLLTMLPAADRLSVCRKGRTLGYILLGVSVFSASFPTLNPWRMPWLYQWLESYGWIRY